MNEVETDARVSRKVLAILAFGLLAAIPSLAASESAAQSGGGETLEDTVIQEMHGGETGTLSTAAVEDSEAGADQVNVRRTEGEWAFGTAVIPAPEKKGAYPQGWLFVAEQTQDGWEVGLEGSPEFSQLAEEAPEAVVDEEEKGLFAQSGEFSTQAAGSRFRLPWHLDRGWTMSGGPHGWSTGYDRPYSSLDFNGGDGKVRAARQGKAYLMCSTRRGWIRVVHSDGYATDYYHLSHNIKPNDGSKRVDEGEFLGNTGTDVSCGGRAYGRHVHFALRRNGEHIAVDGRTIGGWTFQGGQAYQGHAAHRNTRRDPGERLRNYG